MVYKECAELVGRQVALRRYVCRAEHRQQNRVLSADVVEKWGNVSVELVLGHTSAMTDNGVVGSDCVGELYVDPLLTWAIVVDSLVSFRSIFFP